MMDIMTQALQHPGLAVVQILNPCVTFNNMWETWNKMVQPIAASHDSGNRLAANGPGCRRGAPSHRRVL